MDSLTVGLVLAIIALVVSLVVVALFFYRIKQDRDQTIEETRSNTAFIMDPVIREAERLQSQMAPLLQELHNVREVVSDSQKQQSRARDLYETRIAQLEQALAEAAKKGSPSK